MKNFFIAKKDPIVNLVLKSLKELPTPLSISFIWNIGFLLGITLTLQIVTGLVLSMNYVAHTSLAFDSVIHIIRDIDAGWAIRYLHANGASLFFLLIYTHVSRGLYFNSYLKIPIVWASGVIILLASIGAAFIGYVLPWGQMSFWGATVITSIISAIPYVGKEVTLWIWGNFSVSQPTLNRFFSLHFLIPLIIAALVILHLIFLHSTGSSNPTNTNPDLDKIKFFPYFLNKDITPMLVLSVILLVLISLNPNLLGDVENFNPSRMTTTPTHIQPEWYFLFAYAILRAIPSKLGGVIRMVLAIVSLLFLSLKNKNTLRKKFSPTKKTVFWRFISVWILLTWIGIKPVEEPYTFLGKIFSSIYFTLIILI